MPSIRIVCISDTHGRHDKLTVPDGDIFLHAGDISQRGTFDEIDSFNTFLGRLPHTHKIIIAGNHDLTFESEPEAARNRITNATYIEHESIEVEGISIFGSPYTPRFHDWAFNVDRGEPLARLWADIPERTDILITHGPPHRILDRVWNGKSAGCEALTERVRVIKPKIHLFGHIHEAAGDQTIGGTRYINASALYGPIGAIRQQLRAPIVIDFEPG